MNGLRRIDTVDCYRSRRKPSDEILAAVELFKAGDCSTAIFVIIFVELPVWLAVNSELSFMPEYLDFMALDRCLIIV